MKLALLSLVLTSAAFAFETRLAVNDANHIWMYNCDHGVQVSFNVWMENKATVTLKDFRLAGPNVRCKPINPNERTMVLSKVKSKLGQVWEGTHSSGTSVRLFDYRKGAPAGASTKGPMVIWEFDEQGDILRQLYPAVGSRG